MEQLRFPVTKKEAEKAGVHYSSEENKNALFPSRLRALREERGVSQATLALALGVSKSTIGLYETGDTLPDVQTADMVADYFKISVDYLLGRTGVRSTSSDIQSICTYTGLDENAIEWLHDFNLESELCDACIGVLNRFAGSEEFENLLNYIDYAGKVVRESEANRDSRPFPPMKEIAGAVEKVQKTMLQVGLTGFHLVDADKFADYTKGELKEMFMDVFEKFFVKKWAENVK